MGLGFSARLAMALAGVLAVSQAATAGEAPDWSGLYVGAFAGAGSSAGGASITPGSQYAVTYFDNNLVPSHLPLASLGALGGVSWGYNAQSGSAVYGVEADLSLASISASSSERRQMFTVYYDTDAQSRIDAIGTARLRAGALLSGSTLAYITGGLAFGRASLGSGLDMSDNLGPYCGPAGVCAHTSTTQWKLGWTAGAGLEHAFAPNWSVKAEALYYDLGKITQTFLDEHTDSNIPMFDTSRTFSGALLRVGLNYRLR